jgi:TetR/AcrR family transcriptional repressor of nem operon
LARQGDGARGSLTAHVRAQLEARRRRRAIATPAGMVGALTLARAVDDPALSREILAATRDALAKTLSTDD